MMPKVQFPPNMEFQSQLYHLSTTNYNLDYMFDNQNVESENYLVHMLPSNTIQNWFRAEIFQLDHMTTLIHQVHIQNVLVFPSHQPSFPYVQIQYQVHCQVGTTHHQYLHMIQIVLYKIPKNLQTD